MWFTSNSKENFNTCKLYRIVTTGLTLTVKPNNNLDVEGQQNNFIDLAVQVYLEWCAS